jgi:hypothetical protein
MDDNKEESSKVALRSYKCNKTGHVKIDCLFFQNKKKNHHYKKAMKATWSDKSDSSSSDDEEYVANMCFMTIESDNKIFFRMMSLTTFMMNYIMPLNHYMMNLKS